MDTTDVCSLEIQAATDRIADQVRRLPTRETTFAELCDFIRKELLLTLKMRYGGYLYLIFIYLVIKTHLNMVLVQK